MKLNADDCKALLVGDPQECCCFHSTRRAKNELRLTVRELRARGVPVGPNNPLASTSNWKLTVITTLSDDLQCHSSEKKILIYTALTHSFESKFTGVVRPTRHSYLLKFSKHGNSCEALPSGFAYEPQGTAGTTFKSAKSTGTFNLEAPKPSRPLYTAVRPRWQKLLKMSFSTFTNLCYFSQMPPA
jgi:hypothetical protein